MKKFYVFVSLILATIAANAQDSYLTVADGFVAEDIFEEHATLSTFDMKGDVFYAHTGDTIIAIEMTSGNELARYGKPEGYNSWPSFVLAKPELGEIWAGFTVSGNTDDRIYRINTSTGTWEHKATLTGNFDMVSINGKLMVSAATYGEPNKIYLLDTTGNDNHRVIIETGGNSAGIGTDTHGNLFYATSFTQDNIVCTWSITDLWPVITNSESTPLEIIDAQVLTDIPAGAYDCDVDEKGNLAFNYNDYSGDKVLAVWNGTEGNGNNFDIMATSNGASDWFTMVKTRGDFLSPGTENGVYVLSMARPVAKVNGTDAAPELTTPFEPIQAILTTETILVNLDGHFTDPDDDDNFTYSVLSVGNESVAGASIVEDNLQISLGEAGQTSIFIQATNAGRSVTAEVVVGGYAEITGDYIIADFENLDLAEDSYWNGSDGTGGFQTGNILFGNAYNSEYGSWSEWAYSSMSDVTTPGYGNQYSAVTGAGFEPTTSEGTTYGVSYASSWTPPVIKFTDNKAHQVKGFYVTNSTYAALSMKYGDAYAKQFGGEIGIDPDWFKLSVFGYKNGEVVDVIEFYLADYRFENSEEDYILQTWQWVELSELGLVDSLQMSLSSSDNGDWGMNTPSYYCADNFFVSPVEVGIASQEVISEKVAVYPNPANDFIRVAVEDSRTFNANLLDATGKVVLTKTDAENGTAIHIADLPKGMYILQVQTKQGVTAKRIIKK